MRVVVILSLVTLATAYSINSANDHSKDPPLESDFIIEFVNKNQTTWKAGRNFDPRYRIGHRDSLFGLKEGPKRLPPLEDDPEDDLPDVFLPKQFDAREKWKYCKSLREVRDQGDCGSCWAVASAATFTDRLCIATRGHFNADLSSEDIMSCGPGRGCDGGPLVEAWEYFLTVGICTGGDYGSEEGCQPYTIPACDHHVVGHLKNCSYYGVLPTPECKKTCYNKKYTRPKPQDLHRVKKVFSISNDVKKIQKEIFKHGPVTAAFKACQDFLIYKSGVYHHVYGDDCIAHAVKVIGWGTENGTDYWLVANSWNPDWGDKGFFKIKRGNNECGFEENITGGYPDVHGYM